jgi:hypothetical protein
MAASNNSFSPALAAALPFAIALKGENSPIPVLLARYVLARATHAL